MPADKKNETTPDAESVEDNEGITKYQKLIYDALNDVEGIETFATGSRFKDAPLPRITVTGIGQIAFPLLPAQTKDIVAKSTQAPFGRGSETVVDTSVRLCRQIEAEDVQVNEDWQAMVQKYAEEFCVKLGAFEEGGTSNKVEARLYKLVLYEEGGFFKSHKDTEKEPGMFGSLVVQLPAQHDDGQLIVRHRGKEIKFDFSKRSAEYFYASAFYADCEHELIPVKNGVRLCLLYNLVRVGNGDVPKLAIQRGGILDELKKACGIWEEANKDASKLVAPMPGENEVNKGPAKLVILLEHEYTEKNLCFANLKGKDREQANLLSQSGVFELHLALITRHKSGAGEYHGGGRGRYGRRRWYDESEFEDEGGHHEMIDIYDDTIEVTKWVNTMDKTVSHKGLNLDPENETLDGEPLFDSDDEPDAEDYEGYTGNAGPNVDYFYHRACLVVWPRSFSIKIACSAGLGAAIDLARNRINNVSSVAVNSSAETTPDSKINVLQEVWKFTKKQKLADSSSYFNTMLDLFCTVRNVSGAREVLQYMNKEVEMKNMGYFYGRTNVERSGISSENRMKVVCRAIVIFDGDSLKDVVLSLVSSTVETDVHHVAGLALGLKKKENFAAIAADIACELGKKVSSGGVQSSSSATSSSISSNKLALDASATQLVIRVLFGFEECKRFRLSFVDRILTGTTVSVVKGTISVFLDLNKEGVMTDQSKKSATVPDGFERLVDRFIEIALCASKTAPKENLGDVQYVWKKLLGLGLDGVPFQNKFVDGVLMYKSPSVLQSFTKMAEVLHCHTVGVNPEAITRLANARATQLRYDKPQPSNRQPHAEVPGHLQVTNFFRGDSKSFTYSGDFSGINHARNFAHKHQGSANTYNVSEKTSAHWVSNGVGRKAHVIITKTDAAFKKLLEKYDRDQKELSDLSPLLNVAAAGGGVSSSMEPSAKRAKLV